jgi:tRNA1Val (adenine37-N6)-methyltransferase
MKLEARRAELEAELGEPITLDGLSGSFKIFQRKKGHRHSTDDLLTAWYALEHAPHVTRALDLGTGIGTVGLLLASALPALELTCIEAQAISYKFLLENIAANEVGARVHPIHGDLRALAHAHRFPLITGSPPYFPITAGIVPSDSQKAHARFELRGDVSDYARAARAHLEPDGVFVFCFPWPQAERAVVAARDAGFSIVARREVIPRETIAPLFALFACRIGTHPEHVEPPFVVRHADGTHTASLREVRRRFGWDA